MKMLTKYLNLTLLCLLISSCTMSGCMAPTPQPTEELFVPIPPAMPPSCCLAVREAIEQYIESAPVGTSMTFFMADNQAILGSMEIPYGSPAYRRKIAKSKLGAVFDRLNPELSGGPATVDLISVAATVRQNRQSSLPPRVVVIGSPLITDKEGKASISSEYIPCDGCIADSKSSYGKMATFPAGTIIAWLTTRADWGNGPNHRGQVEHFLRLLLEAKGAPLLCMSSSAEVAFSTTTSQWDEGVEVSDNCMGLKKVADDEAKPNVYESDGETQSIELAPDVAIKVRPPAPKYLKGQLQRVVFMPDTSGSVAFDAKLNPRPEVFNAIKEDICEKLDTMEFTHFAICGFGGQGRVEPRLSKFPETFWSKLYWAEATRENRDRAIEFVKNLRAGGGTPTRTALEEALKLDGPMTCILYSDGLPTLGDGGQEGVLGLTEELKKNQVTVNAVGVGSLSVRCESFDWNGGEFLARLAQGTLGEYFALATDESEDADDKDEG